MQLHLQRDMHLLQSESFGVPQSQFLMQLALELPPHKHRAIQRRTGVHSGQPNFIWFTIQLLHWLPSGGQLPHRLPPDGQALAAGNTTNHSNRSSVSFSAPRASAGGLFSIICFWNVWSLLARLYIKEWFSHALFLGENEITTLYYCLLCESFTGSNQYKTNLPHCLLPHSSTRSFSAINCYVLVCTMLLYLRVHLCLHIWDSKSMR